MSRRYNRAPVAQIRKPTFNVVKPFLGTTTIQLNSEMATELASFLEGFDAEDLESDLIKLLQHLKALEDADAQESILGAHITSEDEDLGYEREYSFTASLGGVSCLIVNERAKQLLIEVINECEGQVDRIVWAFRLALEDPTGGPRESRDSSSFHRQHRYNSRHR